MIVSSDETSRHLGHTVSLRRVVLPGGVKGSLWLSAMPGRDFPLASKLTALRAANVVHMVCLVDEMEIAAKAPDYASARMVGTMPCQIHDLPIPDFGLPQDLQGFGAMARKTSGWLHDGLSVAVHCAAGVGRTGLFASAALIAAGLTPEDAAIRVTAAGSVPETEAQAAFLAGFAAGHFAHRD